MTTIVGHSARERKCRAALAARPEVKFMTSYNVAPRPAGCANDGPGLPNRRPLEQSDGWASVTAIRRANRDGRSDWDLG